MKQIYVARNRVEAEMICSELVALGFEAVVQGDLIALPSAAYPAIWVPDDQEAAALEACNTLEINRGDAADA